MSRKGKLKVEYIPIVKLKLYERNPRYNDAAVDAVMESIQAFGFNNPILVGKGNRIIAGHTRLKAAWKLKMAEVPIIRLGHLDEKKFKAYNIADNRTAEIAQWDFGELGKILLELKEEDLLDGIG